MSRRDLWDYKEHGVRFDDCGNYLYISPADHGKIFERCILLRNLNAHCTQARSYEGFSPITVDGVEQMVYVFILEECYEGYDYGPHDDFHSPEKIIYSGFMRNLKGKFEEIYVDTSKNHDAILPKNTTKEDIINLYNYFIKSFDHILYEGKDGL